MCGAQMCIKSVTFCCIMYVMHGEIVVFSLYM